MNSASSTTVRRLSNRSNFFRHFRRQQLKQKSHCSHNDRQTPTQQIPQRCAFTMRARHLNGEQRRAEAGRKEDQGEDYVAGVGYQAILSVRHKMKQMEFERREKELERGKKELERGKKELERGKEEIERGKEEMEQKNRQFEQLSEMKLDLESSRDRLKSMLEKLERTIGDATSKLKSAEQEAQRLAEETHRCRLVVEAKQRKVAEQTHEDQSSAAVAVSDQDAQKEQDKLLQLKDEVNAAQEKHREVSGAENHFQTGVRKQKEELASLSNKKSRIAAEIQAIDAELEQVDKRFIDLVSAERVEDMSLVFTQTNGARRDQESAPRLQFILSKIQRKEYVDAASHGWQYVLRYPFRVLLFLFIMSVVFFFRSAIDLFGESKTAHIELWKQSAAIDDDAINKPRRDAAQHAEQVKTDRAILLDQVFNRDRKFISDHSRIVGRPDMNFEITRALTSTETGIYFLLSGVHGIGKTTAVQLGLEKLARKGYAVAYFSVSKNVRDEFASALGPPLKKDESAIEYMDRVLSKNNLHAIRDKAKENVLSIAKQDGATDAELANLAAGQYPLIFVVDNVNMLLQKDKPLLFDMLSWNKDQCNSPLRDINLVFVSSDGSAPHYMWTLSFSSRLNEVRLHEATGTIARDMLKSQLEANQIKLSDVSLNKAVEVLGGVPTGHHFSHKRFINHVQAKLRESFLENKDNQHNAGIASLSDAEVEAILDAQFSFVKNSIEDSVKEVFTRGVADPVFRQLMRRVVEEANADKPLPRYEANAILEGHRELVPEVVNEMNEKKKTLRDILGEKDLVQVLPGDTVHEGALTLSQRALCRVWERILEEQEKLERKKWLSW